MQPSLMMLGPVIFQARDEMSFTDLGERTDTPWDRIAVAGGLDQTQWTGGAGEDHTIDGVLFPVAHGGEGSLEALRAIQFAGTPVPWVLFSGASRGLVIVEGIDRGSNYFNADAVARRKEYSISISRYVGPAAGISVGSVISLF